MSKLNKEERELLGAFDAGKLKSAVDAVETQARHQSYADAMFKKKRANQHSPVTT